MLEKKKKLDMHTNMGVQVLKNIQQRSIDKLDDIEAELMEQRKLSGEKLQLFKEYL